MARSIKKGPYIDERLLGRIERMNKSGDKRVLKTWSRASTISPEFVGHTVAVHNRKQVHPGVHHGEHGWSQTRRVLPHADVPRSWREACRQAGPDLGRRRQRGDQGNARASDRKEYSYVSQEDAAGDRRDPESGRQ